MATKKSSKRGALPLPDDLDTPKVVVGIADRQAWNAARGLTPQRVAAALNNAHAGDMTAASEILAQVVRADLHIRSVLETRTRAVARLPWQVLPADDTPRAGEIAQAVSELLSHISPPVTGFVRRPQGMAHIIARMMDAVWYGYSLQEIMWVNNGDAGRPQIALTGTRLIPAARVSFVEDLEPRLRLNPADPATVGPSDGKYIYAVNGFGSAFDNDTGIGLAALWLYLFKNFALKDWAARSEIAGQPIRVAEVGPDVQPEERAQIAKALAHLGTNAAAMLPPGVSLKLLESNAASSSGGGGQIYQGLADYADRAFSKGVLGQTLTTDSTGGTGTYATAKTMDGVRADIRDADAMFIGETLTLQLVQPFVRWQFGEGEPVPTLVLQTPKPAETDDRVKALNAAKALGLPVTTAYAYEALNIPAPTDGADLLDYPQGADTTPADTPPPAPAKARVQPGRPLLAALARASDAQIDGALDGLSAACVEQARKILRADFDAVLAALADATDFDDLEARLLVAAAGRPSGELADLLARGHYVAQLFGRSNVAEEGDE
jgi:phage gp29-like protein